MHDPKSLEAFFAQYLPSFKFIIEDYWTDNRAELVDFLSDCISSKIMPEWMNSYFFSMLQQTKAATHEYTNPWTVV
jgi:hypothetical protein